MDQVDKEDLMAQFRAYLDDIEGEPVSATEGDTFSLFAELSGLKNEVKRESRQLKEALDQFKSVFDTLRTGNEALTRELESRRSAEKALRKETLRPLLVQLLDLRDRLEAGHTQSARSKPTALWPCRRQGRLLEALREGQEMTLRRMDRILSDYGVRALEVMGRPLDPHTMRVVEVESRTDQEQGMVTGELRKGFLWDDELLRTAEVKVNKRGEKRD